MPPEFSEQIAKVKKPSKKLITKILIALLVFSIGTSVVFYRSLAKLKQDPKVVAQKETDALMEKLSEHILLPQDEFPTAYTISDVEKLKERDFFANAENGDKLLIYPKAKKAILYSPSKDLVIGVGPFSIGENK